MADEGPVPLAELKNPRHIDDAKAAMRALIKLVPRNFGYADESALLFPAAQAAGNKSGKKAPGKKAKSKRRGGRS
jgi:hypothetical protein